MKEIPLDRVAAEYGACRPKHDRSQDVEGRQELHPRSRGVKGEDDEGGSAKGQGGKRPERRRTPLAEEQPGHGRSEHRLKEVEQVHLRLDPDTRPVAQRGFKGVGQRLREEDGGESLRAGSDRHQG